MKEGIHPDYKDATVTCACGATYQTKSTRGSFGVDVCSACHPFFTGRTRVLDTAGRVERFRKKYENVAKVDVKAQKAAKAEKQAKKRAAKADADNA
jgi:large subunit ribosomal protein L31